jgi:hypothetical protein
MRGLKLTSQRSSNRDIAAELNGPGLFVNTTVRNETVAFALNHVRGVKASS